MSSLPDNICEQRRKISKEYNTLLGRENVDITLTTALVEIFFWFLQNRDEEELCDAVDGSLMFLLDASWLFKSWFLNVAKLYEEAAVTDIVEQIAAKARYLSESNGSLLSDYLLEHLFEHVEIRRAFDSWKDDVDLKKVHASAARWAESHASPTL